MDELLKGLAGDTQLDLDQIKKGVGAVLAFLKEKLGADFSQVANALPGTDSAMKAFESAKGEAGGIMGAVTDMIGKALGGGDVLGSLGKLGFDPGQLAKFIPALIATLQKQLPSDVFDKVKDLMPKLPA